MKGEQFASPPKSDARSYDGGANVTFGASSSATRPGSSTRAVAHRRPLRRRVLQLAAGRLVGGGAPAQAAVVASDTVMASASCFRRNNRARCTRALTAATLRPTIPAISRFERPSTSRSTSTVR